MEIRKPNQKLEMKNPPKKEVEILNEKIDGIDKKLDSFDKKVEKILKLLKDNK